VEGIDHRGLFLGCIEPTHGPSYSFAGLPCGYAGYDLARPGDGRWVRSSTDVRSGRAGPGRVDDRFGHGQRLEVTDTAPVDQGGQQQPAGFGVGDRAVVVDRVNLQLDQQVSELVRVGDHVLAGGGQRANALPHRCGETASLVFGGEESVLEPQVMGDDAAAADELAELLEDLRGRRCGPHHVRGDVVDALGGRIQWDVDARVHEGRVAVDDLAAVVHLYRPDLDDSVPCVAGSAGLEVDADEWVQRQETDVARRWAAHGAGGDDEVLGWGPGRWHRCVLLECWVDPPMPAS
jgi:hypothetical protein